MKMMGMKMEVFQIDKERAYFPTKGWKLSTPRQQGMDSNLLTDAIRYIDNYFKNYFGFIVVKNGHYLNRIITIHMKKCSRLLKACFSLLLQSLETRRYLQR